MKAGTYLGLGHERRVLALQAAVGRLDPTRGAVLQSSDAAVFVQATAVGHVGAAGGLDAPRGMVAAVSYTHLTLPTICSV